MVEGYMFLRINYSVTLVTLHSSLTNRCHQAADGFEIVAISVVEGGEVFAVNVEDGKDRARGIEDGNDNLGTGKAAASNVARELLDIRNDNGLLLLPGSATDSTAIANVHAGYGALKGTKKEFAIVNAIETCPEETHLFMDGGTDVRHHGYHIGLSGYQSLYLLGEQGVFLFLIIHNLLI